MLALILDEIVHITILSYMHALIFRMPVAKKDCGPSSPIRKDGPQHFVTDMTQYVNAGWIP